MQNDEKECLTVLFMTNATGALIPPMIVFPYQRIPYSVSQSVPINWSIGKSENGWMTAETFYEYISNTFEPWLTAQNIERPVILASNANVNTIRNTQSVSTIVNDEDCLDVPSDIPDVFKNTIFWPRKNNSARKKRDLKVKVPSVATSLAWQEYHRTKEMEKSQRLIAIEERKRKRQKTAEKKK
ncbi:PREDICTED: uncharacterized protein LOC105449508 [Wasmannia auropunctata]|uniref:uncharacterized protein LOC105449508 n=1 Tax=Wasmannia auropunctata TaxID=64793 RepID=UPI0005EE0D6D|nr:PREDICTED: uncharacterized protein LOC105449508 [Wasmannia auropunctata]